jgi:hypothetical protein
MIAPQSWTPEARVGGGEGMEKEGKKHRKEQP